MLPAVLTRIPAELLTVRQVREKMAAAPTGSSAVYGGSNADYLLVSTDRARPIDYENYCRAALSTLNLRFPAHAGEGLLAGETKTERAALDARLAPHGLRTAPFQNLSTMPSSSRFAWSNEPNTSTRTSLAPACNNSAAFFLLLLPRVAVT